MTKQCSKCVKVKNVDQFSARLGGIGKRPTCKKCHYLVYTRPFTKSGILKIRRKVAPLVKEGFPALVIARAAMISVPLARRLIQEMRVIR